MWSFHFIHRYNMLLKCIMQLCGRFQSFKCLIEMVVRLEDRFKKIYFFLFKITVIVFQRDLSSIYPKYTFYFKVNNLRLIQ